MFKYNILNRVIVKDQNLINMQKISVSHLSATNAISLKQSLYNNSVPNK